MPIPRKIASGVHSWHPGPPPRAGLLERRQARLADLLVLVRLHARDADAANAYALGEDRQPALDRRDAGHLQELRPILDALLPLERRAARFSRGAALLDRDAGVRRACAVHAREVQQVAAVVEDGDADDPLVLDGFGLGGRGNAAAVLQGQHGLGLHGISSY